MCIAFAWRRRMSAAFRTIRVSHVENLQRPSSATHCGTPKEAHPAKRLLRLLRFPKCVGQFRVTVVGTGGTVVSIAWWFPVLLAERVPLRHCRQLSCIAFLFPPPKVFLHNIQSFSWSSSAATKAVKQDEVFSCEGNCDCPF